MELASIVEQRGQAAGGWIEAFGAAETLGNRSGPREVIPQAVGGSLALISFPFLAADVVPQGIFDDSHEASG